MHQIPGRLTDSEKKDHLIPWSPRHDWHPTHPWWCAWQFWWSFLACLGSGEPSGGSSKEGEEWGDKEKASFVLVDTRIHCIGNIRLTPIPEKEGPHRVKKFKDSVTHSFFESLYLSRWQGRRQGRTGLFRGITLLPEGHWHCRSPPWCSRCAGGQKALRPGVGGRTHPQCRCLWFLHAGPCPRNEQTFGNKSRTVSGGGRTRLLVCPQYTKEWQLQQQKKSTPPWSVSYVSHYSNIFLIFSLLMDWRPREKWLKSIFSAGWVKAEMISSTYLT